MKRKFGMLVVQIQKKNIPLSTKVQGNITVTEKKENRRKTEGKLRKHSN